MIDTEAPTHAAVLTTLQRFTLAGDFRVEDMTNQTAMISVQGPKAVEVISATFHAEAAALSNNQAMQIAATYALEGATLIRFTNTAEQGFDIVVNTEQADEVWSALQNAGARPVGYEALEILRIEAGIPRFGVDMDETNVVTETGLDAAVSYTKGCYIGQEIIARIKYRGHVAKKLSGLRFESNVTAEIGATVKSTDGKEIGRITSVTSSPLLACTIALSYLKFDYLAPGTEVKVVLGDEEGTARVVELPFVRSQDLSAAD